MAGCSSFKFFITDMTQVRLHPLNDWECGGFGKCLEVSLHGLQQRRRCLPDPLLHLHVRRRHQWHPHRDNDGTVLGHGHSSRILQVCRNKLINFKLMQRELLLCGCNKTPFPSCVPLFKGVGLAHLFNAVFIIYYYNVIIAWTVYFFGASFASTLPWTGCDNSGAERSFYSFDQ